MKQKRNSNTAKLFWAVVILLTILGVVVSYWDLDSNIFPEEETSSSISTLIFSTDVIAKTETTVKPATTVKQVTTEKPTYTTTSEHHSVSESIVTTQSTTFEIETEPETTDVPKTTVIYETIPKEEPKKVGTIYLTFDDGPSPKITSQVLDILKENNIKATFFIVDYQIGSYNEELIIRAFNEGHTIGLHGTSHTYSKIYSSLDSLIKNFETLQEKVYTSTGYRPNIIRFPGGTSNTISRLYCEGIMTEATEYFDTTDFVYFDWNVDSQDAGGTKTADGVFKNVTSGIKPGRNNIILMHDSGDKTHTAEALQSIIDWGISEGYEFKAITEETQQLAHKVAN